MEETSCPTLFGRNLRRLRRARGMSVYDLAESIGRHPTYLYRIEVGEQTPGWAVVCELADALGVAADEFRSPCP